MPAEVASTGSLPDLSPVAGKPIVARFDGGLLSSDGGLLALREIEQRLGIAARVAGCIADPRVPEQVTHQIDEICTDHYLSPVLALALPRRREPQPAAIL